MNTRSRQLARLIVRLARAVADIVGECNYATRRMRELAITPDRHLLNPNRAPDTYAEFLYRSSGAPVHEPSAQARSRADPRR